MTLWLGRDALEQVRDKKVIAFGQRLAKRNRLFRKPVWDREVYELIFDDNTILEIGANVRAHRWEC